MQKRASDVQRQHSEFITIPMDVILSKCLKLIYFVEIHYCPSLLKLPTNIKKGLHHLQHKHHKM